MASTLISRRVLRESVRVRTQATGERNQKWTTHPSNPTFFGKHDEKCEILLRYINIQLWKLHVSPLVQCRAGTLS